jgi:hypothetical protein
MKSVEGNLLIRIRFQRGRGPEVHAVRISETDGSLQAKPMDRYKQQNSVVQHCAHDVIHSYIIHADHESDMPDFSVRDEYCNFATGNWHQTVFIGNEQCKGRRWVVTKNLVYAKNNCVNGMQLVSCKRGACASDEI